MGKVFFLMRKHFLGFPAQRKFFQQGAKAILTPTYPKLCPSHARKKMFTEIYWFRQYLSINLKKNLPRPL